MSIDAIKNHIEPFFDSKKNRYFSDIIIIRFGCDKNYFFSRIVKNILFTKSANCYVKL